MHSSARATARSLLLAAVLGAAGALAVLALAGAGSTTRRTVVAHAQARTLDAAQVYARAKDSVAYVAARAPGSQSTGTGFVVARDGLLVTNAHVVDGAATVTAKIGDGPTRPARVVGRDVSHDLALLKVDAGGSGLAPLALGDSTQVQVGDAAYAIGNPFGLDRTLTSGIVSAVQRTIRAPNGVAISGAIQTDAALDPGSSGGPLLDARGRVIGVDSQIATGGGGGGNVGIGFAIPASTVRATVAQLAPGETVAAA
jgi:putative serine protease PepD